MSTRRCFSLLVFPVILGVTMAGNGFGTTLGEVSCEFHTTIDGAVTEFVSGQEIALGPRPDVVPLPDEKKPGRFNDNPDPRQANDFLRAASGLGFMDGPSDENVKVVVAQDSRRYLGFGEFDVSYGKALKKPGALQDDPAQISVLATDSLDDIRRYEDDTRDYKSYRKKFKEDYEGLVTLPSGKMLVVSSGSDMDDYMKGEESFRSVMVIYDQISERVERFQVPEFYLKLTTDSRIVGRPTLVGKPVINVEGVAVRFDGHQGFTIGFFHRANYGKTGHNSMVEFKLHEFLATLYASKTSPDAWRSLKATRIVRLKLPWIKPAGSAGNELFPVNLNDALYGNYDGKPTVIMPVGTEADYTDDQGQHHDGEVIFAGLAVWQGVGDSRGSRCMVFKAPGDLAPGHLSVYGKVEGLAAYNPQGRTPYERSLYRSKALVAGVTDVDSEVEPSVMRVLKLPSVLDYAVY